MLVRLGVIRAGERSAQAIATHSRGALDRPLVDPADQPAELWVAVARDEAVLVGAFQRGIEMPPEWPLCRRGSGGPEVRVGPGTVHVALALAHPGALVPCDEKRIVNRAVRPLLRALAKTGECRALLRPRLDLRFDHPVAWVGFAHDAGSRRTVFEAFVGVAVPFATGPRPSFLGKPVSTLGALRERPMDAGHAPRLADAIVEAYVEVAGGAVEIPVGDVAVPDAGGDASPPPATRAPTRHGRPPARKQSACSALDPMPAAPCASAAICSSRATLSLGWRQGPRAPR